MKVTFYGTGAGASYVADRGGSCVMIEDGDEVILVDCGPGAVRRISQAGIEFGAIKAILMSHLHFDHAGGLPELFRYNLFGMMGIDRPVILGPPGVEDYVESCKSLITAAVNKGLPPHLANLRGERIAAGKDSDVANFIADAIEVPHGPDVHALSWRIKREGKIIVVSGDLKTDEAFMVPFAANADLLVHEAYSTEGREALVTNFPTDVGERARQAYRSSHSEVSAVANVAEKARVRWLAVTHLVPEENEELLVSTVQQHFSGEVFVAQPGQSVKI